MSDYTTHQYVSQKIVKRRVHVHAFALSAFFAATVDSVSLESPLLTVSVVADVVDEPLPAAFRTRRDRLADNAGDSTLVDTADGDTVVSTVLRRTCAANLLARTIALKRTIFSVVSGGSAPSASLIAWTASLNLRVSVFAADRGRIK